MIRLSQYCHCDILHLCYILRNERTDDHTQISFQHDLLSLFVSV